MSQFSTVQIAGASVEVWRGGAGRPLVFLHAGDGIESALPVLESLASRYDVIAPSHPGFGSSDLPDHFTTVDDLAYFYLDLIKQFALKDVVLVGSSICGWIASSMAIKCSDSFSGLVLIGTIGAKFLDESTREITDLFSIPQYNQSQAIYADERKIDYSDWPEETLIRLARNHRSFALFAWSPTLHDPKLRHRLARIDLPALVVWGAEDRVVSLDYGRSFADAIPGARFAVIDHAGHYPHVEASEAFEVALDEFLETLAER